MENANCENCKMKARYDAKPKSLLGRIWKWHIGFCPGWRSYINSLNEEKKQEILLKYGKG